MTVVPGHASDRASALASVRRSFRSAAIALVALAIAFVVLAWLQAARVGWMDDVRTVSRMARQAHWLTAERQGALRGYLLTHAPRERARFDSLAGPVSLRLDSLVAMTRDDPTVGERAEHYRRVVHEWEQLGAAVALSSGDAAPEAALFDSVRASATALLAIEEERYAARVARERGTFRLTDIFAALALGILFGGLWFMRRQLLRQTEVILSHAEREEEHSRVLEGQGEALAQQNEELRLQTEQLQEQAIVLEEQEARLQYTVEELAAGEELFRTVVSSMTDVVFTLGTDLRISQVFGVGEAHEHLDHGAAVGRTPDEVLAATVPGVHHDASERALRGEPVSYTWDALTPAGLRHFSSTVAPLLNGNGTITGVVGAARDITELRDRDAALAAAEEKYRHMQKLDAVGQLAGGVAHDFNNLLTVVIAYASLLLGDRKLAGDDRQAVEEIKHAAERGAHLTRQLLAFSRQQVLRPELVNLSDVVARTERMLARTFESSVAIRVRLAPQEAMVFADEGQLEQILMNLSVNARDAMPAGGTLVLATENAWLGPGDVPGHPELPTGWYVVLTVRDDGIGMSDETRARIFEPFFTTKPVGKGTGLGMSTVHGIVEQSGGLLLVTSEEGRGTICTIILPRAGEMDAAPPARGESGRGLSVSLDTPPGATPHVVEPSEGSGTILLVDDDDAIRSGVARLLARAGHHVIPAASAPEALRLLEQDPRSVHLVLTDMVMPTMSGRELAYEIRVRFPHAAIVLMSGYTKDRVLDDEVLGTETLFLHKPFSGEQLTRTVADALAAARARRREANLPESPFATADGRRTLDAIVSSVDAIVWEADARTGAFHYVNRRAESLLGYSVGRWREPAFFASIMHPDDRDRVLARRAEAARTGKSYSDEFRVLGALGDVFWLHDLVQVVSGPSGESMQLRGIMIDITERKSSELALSNAVHALERERTFLNGVIENLSDSVIVCDERGRIILFNAATRDQLGLPPQFTELSNWSAYYELFHPDGTPMRDNDVPLIRALAGEAVNNAELIVALRSGSRRSFLASARQFVGARGEVLGAVVALRDVTEIKDATRELVLAKEQAERALRTKSEFLSLISHELRTPLTAVIGFAKVLRRNRRGVLTEDELKYVDRISANGNVLLALVNDLLELTQIESELEPAHLAPIDLAATVRNTVLAFDARARAAELDLAWHADPAVGEVPADPVRLESVLAKLIDNAIKFTPAGRVDVRVIEGNGAGGPRIEVADTGEGIPAELMDSIFAPFQQGEDFSRRQHGGSGLGLHLARRQCRMMQCRLSVESEVGKGTTFTIQFPSAHSHAPQGTVREAGTTEDTEEAQRTRSIP